MEFLNGRKDQEQPFFAYVSFMTPHDPLNCPEKYLAMYEAGDMKLPANFMPRHPFDAGVHHIRDENLMKVPRSEDQVLERLARYYALVTHTDARIGRILEALEESGHADNTIIVFTSDNGLALGSHGLMGKQNVYEHSVKVPFIISGPEIPSGETRDQLCYIYDIFPTLCEMAGLQAPDNVEYRSLKPVIHDAGITHREHLSFAFMQWHRAIRDERYKLIDYAVDGSRHTQLFDLDKDPDELRNLAADPDHSATLSRLRQLLEKERVRLNDGTSSSGRGAQGKEFWSTYAAGGS